MNMSLSNQIIAKLQNEYPKWVHGGEIERLSMQNGYMSSHATRRARDLVTAGKIEKTYNEKRQVMYKYIPHSENPVAKKFFEDFPVIPKITVEVRKFNSLF